MSDETNRIVTAVVLGAMLICLGIWFYAVILTPLPPGPLKGECLWGVSRINGTPFPGPEDCATVEASWTPTPPWWQFWGH